MVLDSPAFKEEFEKYLSNLIDIIAHNSHRRKFKSGMRNFNFFRLKIYRAGTL